MGNRDGTKQMQKEAITQSMIFEWTELKSGKYPELELMYHINLINPVEFDYEVTKTRIGGSRNKIEAANLKRQGVKPGVPDICLPVSRGGYHGLYIELKEDKNNPSEKQLEWIENLVMQGYIAVVCYGFDETVKQIQEYLTTERMKK